MSAPSGGNGPEKMTTCEMAALIVDALLRAAVLKHEDVERAVKIVEEEIETRRAIGDY